MFKRIISAAAVEMNFCSTVQVFFVYPTLLRRSPHWKAQEIWRCNRRCFVKNHDNSLWSGHACSRRFIGRDYIYVPKSGHAMTLLVHVLVACTRTRILRVLSVDFSRLSPFANCWSGRFSYEVCCGEYPDQDCFLDGKARGVVSATLLTRRECCGEHFRGTPRYGTFLYDPWHPAVLVPPVA